MRRRYAVVGCGAVGGLYGAPLAAAGHDVTFVVRSGAEAPTAGRAAGAFRRRRRRPAAEVVTAARGCGAALDGEDIGAMVEATEAMVPYRSSMALDLEAGRPMEHDQIHGAVVRAATGAGVAVPRIEALRRQLAVLDGRR